MTASSPNDTPFVARPADRGEPGIATSFQCPLCGGRFTHGTLVCTSCPLNVGCEIVKCPSCGYQFPRRSRLVEWARRWMPRAERP